MVFRKIKVSIIVPVYNAEKYLDRCIHSLIGQTYGDIEIILVDDDSTDSSPVLCDGYAKSDCRIRVIHKENEGAAMARKDGLATACGEYVLFVDSDDWIDPDTVEVCLKTALQDGSDCVMFGYIREYPNRSIMNPLFSCGFSYDTVKSEELIHRRIVGLLGEELAEPHRIDNLSSLAMRLWHIDTVNRGRFVSERTVGTSEDTIFCLYALEGCRISYIDRCFYHYRKDNRLSITTAYKADLAEKWDVMYSIVEEYIESSKRYNAYRIPYLNRVACGMIGLGLNEVNSGQSLIEKSRRLKKILRKPLYERAFKQLDVSYCGRKWKLFFFLCKSKSTVLLAVMLEIMNRMRSQISG